MQQAYLGEKNENNQNALNDCFWMGGGVGKSAIILIPYLCSLWSYRGLNESKALGE